MSILIIDDSPFVLKFHQKLIRDTGYRSPIYSTTDGYEGISLATQFKDDLDLIVLDLNMPDINGFEVIEQIREQIASFVVPIVIVTTETAGAVVALAQQLGAMSFAIKPIDQKIMYAKIRSAFEIASLRRGFF